MAGPLIYKKGLFGGDFSPLDLLPVVWLDGTDDDTITHDANGVSSWSNKGSAGSAFTESNNALKPAKQTGYLQFSADQLVGPNIGVSGRATVIMTMSWTKNNNTRFYNQATGLTNQSGEMSYNSSGNRLNLWNGTVVDALWITPDNDKGCYVILYKSDKAEILKNNVSKGTTSNVVGFDFNGPAMQLGGLYVGSFGVRLTANVYDFQVYNKVLTSDELTSLHNYLKDKHSL